MSNGIQISPLPSQTSIATVRQIFKSFTTQKIIVKGNKAYIKFINPDDFDGLQMIYRDNIIPQLGNAQIIQINEDFEWTLFDGEQGSKKQFKTSDFILPPNKTQNIILEVKARFIVISDCDPKIVNNITQEQIRRKIFTKSKIGKVIKYKTDVYIEFLDQNQIQTLEIIFPELKVKDLGFKASLAPVDQNFSYDLLKKQVQKYQREIAEQQRERAEKLQRKRKQEAELQSIRRQQERRIQESQFSNWNVRPQGQRQSLKQFNTKAIRPQVFWAIIVGLWGFYVMFM